MLWAFLRGPRLLVPGVALVTHEPELASYGVDSAVLMDSTIARAYSDASGGIAALDTLVLVHLLLLSLWPWPVPRGAGTVRTAAGLCDPRNPGMPAGVTD